MTDVEATATLHRGLLLVLEIAEAEAGDAPPPGVGQLAERLSLHQSQASRMLKDLQALELVERDDRTRGFRPGSRFFALAAAGGDPVLASAAGPVLRGLAGRWEEPASLSVLDGNRTLTVRAEVPRGTVGIAASGWIRPSWCTGAGRALLLDHDLPALRSLYPEAPFAEGGPLAVTSLEELAERNARDAAAGLVIADSEFEHGILEIAAPVRDGDGRIVAAVAISVARNRAARDREALADSVGQACRALGASLAAPPATRSA
jgi:DNA-binding IclR family transcriptional regulator